jgi:hypothetical protein
VVSVSSKMVSTYPGDLGGIDKQALTECIEACVECAQACTACAHSCLAEETVADLVTCIRRNLNCADICEATGRVLTRYTPDHAIVARVVLAACAAACKSCGEECRSHADMHDHCRVCAEACGRCEQACRDLLNSLG